MDKEEEYKEFLKKLFSQNNPNKTPEPSLPQKPKNDVGNEFLPKTEKKEIKVRDNVIDSFNYDRSKYEEIYINELPLGFMYEKGSKILIRPCTVKEIQDFSTYDKNNPFDFKNKLNDIIENCVLFQNPDETLSSHVNLLDGDRVWLIYMIREKTFPKGKVLTTKTTYKNENGETVTDVIEIRRENIDIWKDDNIMDYFNENEKVFEFYTELRKEAFIIAPPTLGLKNCFDQYFEMKISNKKVQIKDAPFFKFAPYLKPHITYMSYDELEQFQNWFENDISPDEYSFLMDLINNHLKIGIRGLKKNKGNTILRTAKIYPDEWSTIFIVPNAFELYAKKSNNVGE